MLIAVFRKDFCARAVHSKNILFAIACGILLPALAAQLHCALRVAMPRGCASRTWPRLRPIAFLCESVACASARRGRSIERTEAYRVSRCPRGQPTS